MLLSGTMENVEAEIARVQIEIERVESEYRAAATSQDKEYLREKENKLREKENKLLEKENKLLESKLKKENMLLESKLKKEYMLLESKLKAGVVDKSSEWAASVLTPFDSDSIAESENLKNALAEPLRLKIPISSELYKKLEPRIAEHFISSDVYKADFISCHINIFMGQVLEGGSESLLQSGWDSIFATLWHSLLRLTETDMIKFNRNVTDLSGASTASTCPDLLLWSVHRLVAKFEEKKDSLQEAYNDLMKKLCELPTHYYGPVNWMIGVALAGDEMCVWAMKKGCIPDNLYGPAQIRYPGSRYKCILVSVNLLRIALTLKSVFLKMPFMPCPYKTLPPLTYGRNLIRTINIIYPKVVKSIQPWSSHVAEGFTTWEYVNAAYSLKVPQLINGECVCSRNDTYKVTSQVGYEVEVTSEPAMREAIKDVLHALKALHTAGLVHRDVRWKNILRKADGGWMLIDLETVWKSGCWPTCRLQVWDGETLDGDGNFTEQSDLYLVGKLMLKLPHTGHSLRSQLLNRAYNRAEDALEDDWLHGQRNDFGTNTLASHLTYIP